MKLFGSSGIRAVFNGQLLETAYRVGLSIGKQYSNVVIGKDTRASGDAMLQAVVAGLSAAECNCRSVGVVPTPALAYLTRDFDAGIMITASHNPPEYNGLKLTNRNGSSFDSLQQRVIESIVSQHAYDKTPAAPAVAVDVDAGALERYISAVLSHFPQPIGVKVVVDAGGGAASEVTPLVLEKLGCEVVRLNCTPAAAFPRGSEPSEENLKELCRKVKETGAALGIAHDGDADRMMAVDELGRYVPGDKLLAVFIKTFNYQDVVTTLDASMVIDELGVKIRRTKIGDTFVSEELVKRGDFGGETAGAWVFPAMSLCPDGVFAAAQVASIAAKNKLSRLVDAVPVYPLIRGSLAGPDLDLAKLEKLVMNLKPRGVGKLDGLRFEFKYGWLLVRPSGTEPKIRLTAEAKTEKTAREYYDIGVNAVNKALAAGGGAG